MDPTEMRRPEHTFTYHILRYTSDLVRDEWVNIGILLFDPLTGQLRLRLVEGQDEYARIRRLDPRADEDAIRQLRDHLEERFGAFVQNNRADEGPTLAPGEAVQAVIDTWNATLSNGIQLASPRAVHADDIEIETDRLYLEHVTPPRREMRVGAPGSRSSIRGYCGQVWRQAKLWDKIRKSVRVDEFTFPGDPMRIDYEYRYNGTHGFVQTLSVSRSPKDCKELGYSAERIARRAPFRSEFTAVTDVTLSLENPRHRFVRETLREAGIETIPVEGFAVWVAKLKPLLQ